MPVRLQARRRRCQFGGGPRSPCIQPLGQAPDIQAAKEKRCPWPVEADGSDPPPVVTERALARSVGSSHISTVSQLALRGPRERTLNETT